MVCAACVHVPLAAACMAALPGQQVHSQHTSADLAARIRSVLCRHCAACSSVRGSQATFSSQLLRWRLRSHVGYVSTRLLLCLRQGRSQDTHLAPAVRAQSGSGQHCAACNRPRSDSPVFRHTCCPGGQGPCMLHQHCTACSAARASLASCGPHLLSWLMQHCAAESQMWCVSTKPHIGPIRQSCSTNLLCWRPGSGAPASSAPWLPVCGRVLLRSREVVAGRPSLPACRRCRFRLTSRAKPAMPCRT